MTAVVWDEVGLRFYETGIDHAVLYLSDGSAVPWNGLTGVEEDTSSKTSTPYYLDGQKYLDSVTTGNFSATINAYTYPDEFLEIEGISEIADGFYSDNQPSGTFGLIYRTKIGNDVDGLDHGYKLHFLYNMSVVPTAKSYETLNANVEPGEFSWSITGVPEVNGAGKPTSHYILDSRRVDPLVLAYIEGLLFGTDESDPFLIPPAYIRYIIETWVPPVPTLIVTDLGGGLWSAEGEGVVMVDGTTYTIESDTISPISTDIYTISSG